MSLEAVQKVTEAEQKAQARKAEAAENAKKLVAEAERAGKDRVAGTRAEAEAQVREMLTKAEASAALHTEKVMAETRKSCDSLRQAASGKLDEASALIIRRVVNV